MRYVCSLALLCSLPALAVKFYPDDPLWREPAPVSLPDVEARRLDPLVDFYKNTFKTKGERNVRKRVHPSQGVNTLDEAYDSAWYTNRHWLNRMSQEELARGPNRTAPPSADGHWTVTSAKSEGVTPGFTIADAKGRRYLLKFDPPANPELASAADVIGAKFFYALGYNTPENYIVRFRREQLTVKPGVKFTDRYDRTRNLNEKDVDDLLAALPRGADGTYRALASLYISGKSLGGFKYYKRRPEDRNEIAPHEHLRVLRGLYVSAAWLNHTDAKALNSLDTFVEENGRKFVKHYLIDFGASLGSDSFAAKDPRLGHAFFIEKEAGLGQLLSFGLIVPKYARVEYPKNPAVGNFEVESFDPNDWKSNYPNAAFLNRLPGDEFWGAKQVMAFTDEDIRTIVHTGEYSDPAAEQMVADVLIKRRDKIGRVLLPKLLPLDRFAVQGDRLVFTDLLAASNLRPARSYQISWALYDNQTGQRSPLAGRVDAALPAEVLRSAPGSYAAATIRNDEPGKSITVYLRHADQWQVVGIDREGSNAWEGQ